MNTRQKFTTIEEQISLLKSRGLSFDSEHRAYNLLDNYGYYNIINGYKDAYIIKDSQDEQYKKGVTFEQIFSLFCLDHAIRNQVMITMLDLEEHLRAVTAYTVGKAFGHKQDDYLNFKNYQNRKSTNPRFRLDSILDNLKKASYSDKDPIRYHRELYGNVPPWVLFKGVYLSTLVNFIKVQKPKQKSEIICRFYDIEYDEVNKYIKDLFTDTLFLCLEYRNLAAHGGRIYNHVADSRVRVTSESEKYLSVRISNFSNLHTVHSLGVLICLFDLFAKKDYRLSLTQTIEHEVKKHCYIYPKDFDYLMTSIGIKNIVHKC